MYRHLSKYVTSKVTSRNIVYLLTLLYIGLLVMYIINPEPIEDFFNWLALDVLLYPFRRDIWY